MKAGIKTLQMVIVAKIKGTTIPYDATNLLIPLLCMKAFLQTVITKALIHSCIKPASTRELAKVLVKLEIKKNKKLISPALAISFECLSSMGSRIYFALWMDDSHRTQILSKGCF